MIFVMSTLLIGYTPPVAQGASVVITDAVQLVDGGAVNERMASMTSDSDGNTVSYTHLTLPTKRIV